MMGIWPDRFTNSWAEGVQSVLLGPVKGWLAEHPVMGWLVGHPLWALALALALVLVLLFAGLWSAIARLTEGFWLSLVRLPFRLSAWIFAAVSRLLVRRWAKPAGPEDEGDRLGEIMVRLQALQGEQETLLNEMRTLLKHDQP